MIQSVKQCNSSQGFNPRYSASFIKPVIHSWTISVSFPGSDEGHQNCTSVLKKTALTQKPALQWNATTHLFYLRHGGLASVELRWWKRQLCDSLTSLDAELSTEAAAAAAALLTATVWRLATECATVSGSCQRQRICHRCS